MNTALFLTLTQTAAKEEKEDRGREAETGGESQEGHGLEKKSTKKVKFTWIPIV